MSEADWKAHVETRLDHIETSLGVLPAMQRRMEDLSKTDAVEQVHREYVQDTLNSIRGGIKWVLLLIIAALVSSGMAFVIQGGLAGS